VFYLNTTFSERIDTGSDTTQCKLLLKRENKQNKYMMMLSNKQNWKEIAKDISNAHHTKFLKCSAWIEFDKQLLG
jgi:hypothetical protein